MVCLGCSEGSTSGYLHTPSVKKTLEIRWVPGWPWLSDEVSNLSSIAGTPHAARLVLASLAQCLSAREEKAGGCWTKWVLSRRGRGLEKVRRDPTLACCYSE